MPETGTETALEQAKQLLAALMRTRFRLKSGLELSVSASVGLSTAPADGSQVHSVIGAADIRMYAVKASGRGSVRAV
jgi:diguanylate cyclase (GGDEF)-like protein